MLLTRRPRLTIAASAMALAAVVATGSPAAFAATPTTVSYTENTSGVLANPDRGFYHQLETHYKDGSGTGWTALDVNTLKGYRAQGITVVRRMFFLEWFATQPDLNADVQAKIKADFQAARDAGVTLIVRFAYTDTNKGDTGIDAPVGAATQQIKTLGKDGGVFKSYVDVINVVEAGFVGAWGEGYYTQNYGNKGNISQTDWNNRNAIIRALLDAVPNWRNIVVRYPQLKQRFFNSSGGSYPTLSASTAYNNSDIARIGFHNDCFGRYDNEGGTWKSNPVSIDQNYLATETQWVPMEGETCSDYDAQGNEVFNGPTQSEAESGIAKYHYSALNLDFSNTVFQKWNPTYKTDIANKLGYRIVLKKGGWTGTTVSVDLVNKGSAAPIYLRRATLVLKRASDGVALPGIAFDGGDVRQWTPGAAKTITASFAGVSAGTYNAYLSIPSPETGLAANPNYAIQTANSGLWDGSGLIDLKFQVTK